MAVSCGFAKQSEHRGVAAAEDVARSTDSVAPHRFVAVHGRQAAVMGYSEQGLEVWGYPFQILDGYQIGFRSGSATTETDGSLLLRRILYRPDSIIRIYIGPDYMVRERLFVPLNRTAAILTYEVTAQHPLEVDIHFRPILNLMWPGALGGQTTEWNQEVGGYVLSEPLRGISAVVASPEIVAHDETVNTTLRPSNKLSFSIRPRGSSKGSSLATVYIALQTENKKNYAAAIHDLSTHEAQLNTEAGEHYAMLDRNAIRIHSPDSDLNSALAWAETALDQAWVCNPDLGCGVVAGYGPSRDARRPQYDWFFAGDGLVATNALVAAGEYSRAREELEFIIKYQDMKTGMIWHELAQSAGYLDWPKSGYMFVHVDITFSYLNTVAQYVLASGDTGFAHDHWDSIAAAYRYCQSLIQPSDHLPHIPAGKEGGDEQDRPSDDLSLSSSWVTASSSFAQLAKITGHVQPPADAMRANRLARQSIPARYWDAKRHFWIDGHTESGAAITARRSGPSEAIIQDIFAPQQKEAILDQLASSDFRSDWGMRSVAANSKIYDPYSYSKGSVSALHTTTESAMFWHEHRSAIALDLWRSILPWNTLDSLGHIHEVLAGNYYSEQEESVPEQTWSSAGMLDAAVHGLLGLEVDGVTGSLVFSPHIPAEWKQVTVANIHLPHSAVSFDIIQALDGLDLEITNEGGPAKILFEPQIPLGAQIHGAEFQNHEVVAETERFEEEENAKVELEAPTGKSHFRLRFTGGVSVILKPPTPALGDSSRGMKLIGIRLQDQTLTIDADVKLGSDSSFEVQTPWKVVTARGATVTALQDSRYEIRPQPTPATGRNSDYVPTHLSIAFTQK
jgi:glycogen debranching enzyme